MSREASIRTANAPRIYLAGPDIFLQNRDDIYRSLKAHCARFGVVGVAPTDESIEKAAEASSADLAQSIYEKNVALVRTADGVIANLMSFRGQEPDSGTVFEVGYAVALGKPVVAYGVPPGTYAERVAASIACEADQGVVREKANGTVVEGLAQRLNLMLSRSTSIAATPEEAIQSLAARLLRPDRSQDI